MSLESPGSNGFRGFFVFWRDGRRLGLGHLPVLARTPPSVLPDISPSRGEISKGRPHARPLALRISACAFTQTHAICIPIRVLGGDRPPHLISPLEGEMPGRAEGGMPRTCASLWLVAPCGFRILVEYSLSRKVTRSREGGGSHEWDFVDQLCMPCCASDLRSVGGKRSRPGMPPEGE